MVYLNRIYTKSGDAGETSLGDGHRVAKTHPRIVAYGGVDELNSVIGLALSTSVPDELAAWLRQIQNDLFDLGADLCVPESEPGSAECGTGSAECGTGSAECGTGNAECGMQNSELPTPHSQLRTPNSALPTPHSQLRTPNRVIAKLITTLENRIDAANLRLKPLESFVLPGGSLTAAHLHHARTVCRRVEISVLQLAQQEHINPHVAIYLNRLSDLLFVLARVCNANGENDILWVPGRSRDANRQNDS